MKIYLLIIGLLFYLLGNGQIKLTPKQTKLFDGKTFNGWEGDTVYTWHILNNYLAGGSVSKSVPHNEFLFTTERFGDFELSLEFKLMGTGFVNAGVQFHSEHTIDPAYEMAGYQADLGEGYWASLYDESRRNVTIVNPDSGLIKKILKPNQWNRFAIKSIGRSLHILLIFFELIIFPFKVIA